MEWVNGGGLSCWVEAGVRSGLEYAEQQSPVRQRLDPIWEWGNCPHRCQKSPAASSLILILFATVCFLDNRARYQSVVIRRDQCCAPTAPHISLKSPCPVCRTFPTSNRCRMSEPSHAASLTHSIPTPWPGGVRPSRYEARPCLSPLPRFSFLVNQVQGCQIGTLFRCET